MRRDEDDILGRVVAREVYVERIVDSDGIDLGASEDRRELVESYDGSVESHVTRSIGLLACGHPRRQGMPLARCERCSEREKRNIQVCMACANICAVCGRATCLRCTKPTPEGFRFCKKCYRKGLKLIRQGDTPARSESTFSVVRHLIATLLRFW